MTSKTPRTGNQYSIHYGDYSAVICELGAKIRRFDYQGKEIFCPFGVNDLTPTCNGYVRRLTNIIPHRATMRTTDTPTTTCGSLNR